MAIPTKIEIKGLREIRAAMLQLPKKFDRPLLNKALLVGARLIRDDAKSRVPLLKEPDARRVRGAIQRAIHAGAVRPERYTASVWVRVRQLTRKQISSFKKKGSKKGSASAQSNPLDPFYWRFVEFGTSKMAARPFMRPAFEARKMDAVQAAIADLRPRVAAEIEKLGRSFRL